jgi:transposase
MKVQQRVVRVWQRLSLRERRVMRSRSKHASCAVLRCRCKIIVSLVQGKSPTMLASGGLCSESQVYRVAQRFVEQGLAGMADQREDNGDHKISEAYEWELLIAVARSPRNYGYMRTTWTQELLVRVLAKRTGITVSVTTVCRLLHRHRVRLGRPKPIVGCPWPKARRVRRLRQIRKLVRSVRRNEVVVYVDEVDIHLNPKIGPDWMLCGQQKQVLTPGKNQKRYLAGALDARRGRLTYVEADRKTSDLFILLLWQLLKEYPRSRCIHVVLDNFKIHHSQRTQLALAAAGGRIRLHFLPPYCPDHNRIERVWKDLHDNVTRNHCCQNMKQLMSEVYDYLRCRNRHGRHAYVHTQVA